ncbi:MAG: hypothetical protein CO090_10185 [Acidobacteria bacterium CG_4_9_14_3_um_filter_49_7]|nr:MAG: hypothetical protein CO090_10185 [Acidobacteria bacterium CG_4_9_14_3_um_filter_49_7]
MMKKVGGLLFLLFSITAFSQWYAGLTNPNVRVTLTHPPQLMVKIDRLAFYPDRSRSSRELADYLVSYFVNDGRIEVMDRQHIDAILTEQNMGVYGRMDPGTAARLGKVLGPAAFVFVKVYRDRYEREHLTEEYKSNGKKKIKYISKITVSMKFSFQTTDLSTGKIFQSTVFEKDRDQQNVNYEKGYPEYPSVENLRDDLMKEAVVEVSHFFLPWNETLSPVFFNDKTCGMKQAFQALGSGDMAEAFRLSRNAAQCAEKNMSVKAKQRSRTYYNLGMCYFLDRDYDNAVQYFEKAYRIKDYHMYKTAISNAIKAKQLEVDLNKVEAMADEAAQPVQQTEQQTTPADNAGTNIEAKLEQLKHLFDKGLITKEEYQKKRIELLNQL